jgi:hypothetical protein
MGPAGLIGPAGPAAPSRSYLSLPVGVAAPAGYTLLGTFEMVLNPVSGDRFYELYPMTIALWQKQ